MLTINYNDIIQEIISKTEEYLEIPSVIKHEELFILHLKKDLEKIGLKTQNHNNSFLTAKTEIESEYIFSAHIDRHGFFKNKNNAIAYAAFEYLKANKLSLPHEVRSIGENAILPKIKNDDILIKEFRDFILISDKEHKNVKFSKPFALDFFEKIGLRYTKDLIRGYDIKTNSFSKWSQIKSYNTSVDSKTVSFNLLDSDFKELNKFNVFQLNSKCFTYQNYFSGQIDNIISTATIFVLLKHKLISGTFIFTTLEEVGESYKQIVEFFNKNTKELSHKKLLILDTSPYDSFENKKEGFLTLRHGDENGGFDSQLVEKIQNKLEKSNIPYDFKPSFMGKTELGRVSTETKGKINGTTIQLPTLNYHTSHETCELKGLENYSKVLVQLFEK